MNKTQALQFFLQVANDLDIPPTTATVDTTASGALDLTFEWGTASASNTISSILAIVEVLN